MNGLLSSFRPLPWTFTILTGIFVTPLTRAEANESEGAEARRRPNVVIILADDLGYADVGFHGCKDIPTPHIDSLAAGGVRCASGYVSAPVCSPMRAGLMTGRYQQRFGYEFNPGPIQRASPKYGVPLDEAMLPALMKKQGYVTGIVGKWHLGIRKEYHPMRRGFDSFFGFLHGSHSYVDSRADSLNPIVAGYETVEEKAYLTNAFTREAVAFIDRHHGRPFLLYLAYNAVHGPLQAPQRYLERFPEIGNERRRTYAAMLSCMDDGVGRVLDAIRRHGLEGDTLIFFLSDNGGPPQANASRNDPLRGIKGTTYEGGIRVPFVVQWKGHLPAGKVYDHPVISLDILPTAMAAGRGRLPEGKTLDGVNLLPYLAGERTSPPHETLYWRIGDRQAIRHGHLKLVCEGRSPWELYNLANDIGEATDLADHQPAAVTKLEEKYADWSNRLADPLWDAVGHRAKRR